MNESKFKVGDKVTVKGFHTVYTVKAVMAEEGSQISYSLGWAVDHENTWWNYYEQDLAPAQLAPIDVLAEKSAETDALKAKIARMQKIATSVRRDMAVVLAFNQPVSLDDLSNWFNQIAELSVAKAPTTAAPQAEAVTLSDAEIEWLAKHWYEHNKLFRRDFTIFDKDVPLRVIHKIEHNSTRFSYYELAKVYDTEANRAAIAARRQALGL